MSGEHAAAPLDKLHFISVEFAGVCEGCLSGVGGECHSPGCLFWLMAAPDLDLRSRLVEMYGAQISESVTITPSFTRVGRCAELEARVEALEKAGELAAKAMDALAMATPDRVLRNVAQQAAKKFRAALTPPVTT